MNICIKCKYHRGRGDMWYDQHCAHPDTLREPTVDPVMGRKAFMGRNSLGDVYFTTEQMPYCREMNPTGECSLFEPR